MKSSASSTRRAGLMPVALLLAGMFAFAGCSTPTQPAAMVVAPQAVLPGSSGTVAVTVSGGDETSATGTSQISDEDFRQALEQSIRDSRVFAGIEERSDARYQLDAHIGMLSQPMMGFSMTVSIEVNYRITDLREGTVVFEENIDTEHTTSAGAAFAAVTRIRMATEGAARENIAQFLEAVSAAGLD
ncbi:MAG: hypothetical protein JJU00_18190 [Opitutales bacterium]|nr:hypothetical protein [Opitutales bacterium]